MSAYLLSNENISNLATGIAGVINHPTLSGYTGGRYWLGKALPPKAFERGGLNSGILARAMFNLNAESVAQRYSETPEKAPDTFPKGADLSRNIPQLIKGLSSFLYQSCEGDCPDSALYKALEKFQADMMNYQLQAMGAFDNVEWY